MKIDFSQPSYAMECETARLLHSFGVNLQTREIFLSSHETNESDEEPGVDWRMAARLNKNLRLLCTGDRSGDPVLIHMHTIGGSWEDGMAIYDSIKSCADTHITIIAHAHARSMSSLILQAGDTRILMPNAVWLMHMGSMAFDGDAQSFEAEAKETMKDNERMIDIYTNSAVGSKEYKGKNKKQVRKAISEGLRMKQEWYMSPRQAVNCGYADAVLGDKGYEKISKIHETGCY